MAGSRATRELTLGTLSYPRPRPDPVRLTSPLEPVPDLRIPVLLEQRQKCLLDRRVVLVQPLDLGFGHDGPVDQGGLDGDLHELVGHSFGGRVDVTKYGWIGV
jgi:hypothetical protein